MKNHKSTFQILVAKIYFSHTAIAKEVPDYKKV